MNQIDNYKIVKKIGEGGMGEVYKGIEIMLEREVAIKLLKPELKNRPDIIQRFQDELKVLARLNHSNVTTLYEYKFDPIQDKYYMALEFARGEPLEERLKKEGTLPWQTAVQCTIGLLEGLDHAHSFDVVHRDIKPSNIMITEQNSIKILDFGIARILETARLTQTGQFIGTLEYASPEHIQGKDTDLRSDIYSVGAVLYEMLTGHIPFEKTTDYDLRRSIVEKKPQSLLKFSTQIPVKLEQLVLKALEKKPENRFSSAKEFSKELHKIALGSENLQFDPSNGWFRTFGKEYPSVILLLSLLIAGGGYLLWKPNNFSNANDSTRISQHVPTVPTVQTEPTEPKISQDKVDAEYPQKNNNEIVPELLPPPPIKLPQIISETSKQQSEDEFGSKSPPTKTPKIKSTKYKQEQKIDEESFEPEPDPGIESAAKNFFRH